MKRKSILIIGILIATLNSCVYSLFPIYTEDTVVFREELLGKWDLNEDGSEYMIFETVGDDGPEDEEGEVTYEYVVEINEDMTMSSNEPIFILQNGRKVYDVDSIKMIMNERLGTTSDQPTEQEKSTKATGSTTITEEKTEPKIEEYKGSISVFEENSYQLTIFDSEGEKEAYTAHLVEIGEDLFLDLYPIKQFDSKNLSDNYFPVHTFYKVKVTEDTFTMIHFDLDKLNKLFESNLIRLRHENVEGTILITAQPKELQKFIDKYSDDESVFDEVEIYKKAEI